MAINIAPKSLDTELSELMREVSTGKEQLPEFQRGWTWDNDRIRGIKYKWDVILLPRLNRNLGVRVWKLKKEILLFFLYRL